MACCRPPLRESILVTATTYSPPETEDIINGLLQATATGKYFGNGHYLFAT